MANQPLQVIKAVSALPSPLAPNTFYLVRVNQGYDLYATDTTGSNAYKINVSPNQITDAIAIAQGGTGAKDAETARGNLGLGTVSQRNVGVDFGQVSINEDIKKTWSKISASWIPDYYNLNDIAGGDYLFYARPDSTGIQNPPPFNYCAVHAFRTFSNEEQLFAIAYDYFNPQIALRAKNNGNWYDWAVMASNGLPAYFASLKSGQASYAKGWRKLTATLPNQAGEITRAHGVTTVETVQAKVTNSDGIVIYNNDIDPANQFYVRVNGANLILGVTASSTKVFGKAVTIYVGEEL